jgi:hypothetical protein
MSWRLGLEAGYIFVKPGVVNSYRVTNHETKLAHYRPKSIDERVRVRREPIMGFHQVAEPQWCPRRMTADPSPHESLICLSPSATRVGLVG